VTLVVPVVEESKIEAPPPAPSTEADADAPPLETEHSVAKSPPAPAASIVVGTTPAQTVAAAPVPTLPSKPPNSVPTVPVPRTFTASRSAKQAEAPAAEAVAVNETQTEASRPPSLAPKEDEPSSGKVGAREANRLLNNFSHAYESGDIADMRALFAADARGPRGGVDVILSDYKRVFASSSERRLNVRDVSWFITGDTLTIIASFDATVTKGRAGRPRRSHGDLRLDLRREKDQWYIYRLQHDELPG
jgi:ketosteroid isomerase-like protein